ncbi:MAG: hypothetical protein Q9M36_14665 [Sulfurovum sp.]|nr:hypothetical protein [Sulfurovum sp.]
MKLFSNKKEIDFKEIINSNEGIDAQALKILSQEIREDVLKTIMIRRTRADIQSHNIIFPEVLAPIEHEYELEEGLKNIFIDTGKKISEELKYTRFNALHYLTAEARIKYYKTENDNIFDKNPLAGIMKTLLIKRFESSLEAFKISIYRHLKRYETFIANFKEDKIYLGKKSSDILDYDENSEDYDDFIQKLKDKGKIRVLNKNDFEANFLPHLEEDYFIFKNLVEQWKEIHKDPKLEKFREEIKKRGLSK